MMRVKKVVKISILVLIVSIIVVGIYLAYFFLIGIPKTQARTYYNQAMVKLEEGNRQGAKEDLRKALTYWNEAYIQEQLTIIN